MRTPVEEAIGELRLAFPSSCVLHREDGNGGAYVIVEEVRIGPKYRPTLTWLGGHITEWYPYADIYPLFMSAEVSRVDGMAFQPPVTTGVNFENRPAIQISRSNNQTQSSPQSAQVKFLKVQQFLIDLP